MSVLTRLLIALGRHGHLKGEIAADIAEAADAVRRTSGDAAAQRRALALAARSSVDAWRYRLHGRLRDVTGSRQTRDSLLTSMLLDIIAGLRLLRRSPGFAAAAVLMIAFGVGSTTAIFSIANAQLMTPLPYEDGRRVVFVRGWDVEANRLLFSMPVTDYLDLRDANALEAASAYRYWSTSLTGRPIPERLQGYFVTGNTFDMLGVPAALGRTLQRSDDGAQPARVVVLSHQAWLAHFGGDASIVGRGVQLDGQPYEVVGVMPKSFEFPVLNFKGDLWVPFGMNEAAIRAAARADAETATVVGRRRDGQSVDEAQAAVTAVMNRLRTEHPISNRSLGASVIGMQEMGLQALRPAIVALMIAASLVLLLACANLASLMFARGVARTRELAVRAALGAGRGRLVRQLLTETLVLTTAGGLIGALGAWWLMELFRTSLPPFIRSVLPNLDFLRVEGRALLVAFGCSTIAGVLSGVLPALRASRDAAGDALRVRDGAPAGSRRATGALVAVQVALSVVLLCGAVLLMRSFTNITRVDPGFDGRGVLTMTVTLPEARYAEAPRQRQFFERSLERIAALPGVESAAAVNVLPFSTYNRGGSVRVPGLEEPARTNVRVATPEYLATIGVPVVRGRALTRQDREGAQRVALVNREFERRYLNGQAVLGSTIRFGDTPAGDRVILGVIGNVLHDTLVEGPEPEVYTPFAQAPSGFMMLAIRASDPMRQATAVRRAIAEVDPLQPVFEVATLDALVARAAAPYRQLSTVMSVIALAAAALALVGLYALVAYSAKQRTREVGVRLALGATRARVVTDMMRGALALTAAGTCIGLGAALLVMAGLESLLFGITTRDPVTLVAVPLALTACAAVATYMPARRASRVDPAITLRD